MQVGVNFILKNSDMKSFLSRINNKVMCNGSCFATNLMVMQQINEVQKSPKSHCFGEIGTPDVDSHYNPLEVNSGYTGSI